jgi:hypothetical protein
VQKHVEVLSEKHLQLHAGIWQKEKFLERLPTPTVHHDVLQAHMHNQVAIHKTPHKSVNSLPVFGQEKSDMFQLAVMSDSRA